MHLSLLQAGRPLQEVLGGCIVQACLELASAQLLHSDQAGVWAQKPRLNGTPLHRDLLGD